MEDQMEKQNVTLSLPKDILRNAKAAAAINDKSLSAFLLEALKDKLEESRDYDAAMRRQMKGLKRGLPLGTGGQITWTREELHERR
jgi:hypothetical protein